MNKETTAYLDYHYICAEQNKSDFMENAERFANDLEDYAKSIRKALADVGDDPNLDKMHYLLYKFKDCASQLQFRHDAAEEDYQRLNLRRSMINAAESIIKLSEKQEEEAE